MSIPPRARRKAGPAGDELLRDQGDSTVTTTTTVNRGQHSGARITNSSDQSISANTDTTLSYNTVHYDTNSYYNASTPTRLTAPMNGFYAVWANHVWEAPVADDGSRTAFLQLDGVAVSNGAGTGTIGSQSIISGFQQTGHEVQTLVYLEQGQYIEVVVRATSAKKVLSPASYGTANDQATPEFGMTLLGIFAPTSDF